MSLNFLFYLGIMMYSLSAANFMIIIMLVEVLSWSFSFFLKFDSLKYLLVQSFFFLGSLFSVLLVQKLVFLFFMFKMGLPPFYSWVFLLMSKVQKLVFLFFFSIHKILPLIFLSKTFLSNMILLLVLVYTMFTVYQVSNLFFVFILSSVLQTLWMVFILLVSSSLFFLYWSAYSLILWAFLKSMGTKDMLTLSLMQNSMSMFFWVVISGFPPFLMFWFKLSLIVLLLKSLMIIVSLTLLLSSLIMIVVYYRVFTVSLINHSLMNSSLGMLLPLLFFFF